MGWGLIVHFINAPSPPSPEVGTCEAGPKAESVRQVTHGPLQEANGPPKGMTKSSAPNHVSRLRLSNFDNLDRLLEAGLFQHIGDVFRGVGGGATRIKPL
jgi:hypothetical protein